MPVDKIAFYAAGWQIHVENLAAYLAGRERDDAEARWDALVPPYQDQTAHLESDMTGDRPEGPEDQALLAFLAAQRGVVLSIVDGLDEAAWHRAVVPSGWTPAGLVEHLGGAEYHWFQQVVADSTEEPAKDEGEDQPPYDPTAAFVSDRSSAEIVRDYRDECARSDAVLAVTSLSAPPRGRHGDPEMDEPPNVRWVVLHMIEETARHAGHLDIARELIDGRTGLGPR